MFTIGIPRFPKLVSTQASAAFIEAEATALDDAALKSEAHFAQALAALIAR